jgi:thiamine-phosphate pyrophosphorylase
MGRGIEGVYAITPDHLDSALLINLTRAMLEAGVRNIQYRRKLTPLEPQLVEARQLQALVAPYGASLIINDNLALALEVGAAGVHWGRDDVGAPSVASLAHDINTARAKAAGAGLPEPFVVGISCYDDYARAEMAARAGANYVAFGSMFPSSTKPSATIAPVALITRAKQNLGIPVVAIGGITRDNATALVEAGVDAVAVISDLFSATDNWQIAERVKEFEYLFSAHSTITNNENN